jgi:hypothetical protein
MIRLSVGFSNVLDDLTLTDSQSSIACFDNKNTVKSINSKQGLGFITANNNKQ